MRGFVDAIERFRAGGIEKFSGDPEVDPKNRREEGDRIESPSKPLSQDPPIRRRLRFKERLAWEPCIQSEGLLRTISCFDKFLFSHKEAMKFWVTLFLFAGLLIISPLEATEPTSVPPPSHQLINSSFAPGERLTYDITYLGANAGSAVMEVLERTKMKGREVYHIVSTAQSNDFVSLFYPVDDRVESYIDVEGLYSHYIRIKQHQGKRKREKVISFDQVQHRAVQLKNDKQKIFEIPPQVQDSLSSLYFFRVKNAVEVGRSVFIEVHESEKNWLLEIRGVARERVTTPVGTFDTIKVQAMVRYEGLFMDRGDVFIWFTEDEKRIPVMMQSKIKIGSITAVLSSRREGNHLSHSVLSKAEKNLDNSQE